MSVAQLCGPVFRWYTLLIFRHVLGFFLFFLFFFVFLLFCSPVGFLRERTSKPGYRTDKTIVVQTNSGRTLGVSSLTGAIRWSVQLAERDATSQVRCTFTHHARDLPAP